MKKVDLVSALVVVIGLELMLAGCAWLTDSKPIVRTVDNIAREMCSTFFAQKQGISVEDALKSYCQAREDWAPWIDPLLQAQAEGDLAAAAGGTSAASPTCPSAAPSAAPAGVLRLGLPNGATSAKTLPQTPPKASAEPPSTGPVPGSNGTRTVPAQYEDR